MSAYADGGCLRCGAMVSDEDRHDRWHDGMCGHRDPATGLTCMNRPPCDGPHRTDFSPHTWLTRPWMVSSPLRTV